jgi:hypothetical protein
MARLLPAALAATALLLSPAARGAETVTDLLFGKDLFANVTAPLRLDYAYLAREGPAGPTRRGDVALEVRSVDAEGAKQVFLDLEDGAVHREFGPLRMTQQNPLVILFLQRDVQSMEGVTGGSQHYFRNRIREAFNGPAEVERLEVDHDGRKVPATRIAIRPFAQDPELARFPEFKDKVYEFTVAETLPGGIYRLATRRPDPADGTRTIEESMTLAGTAARN